jgi:hypothetical protein
MAVLGLMAGSVAMHALFAVHWDQLALSASPGDDDEGYFFLAYQILGHIPESPNFLFRSPGWPLMIAGLLRIAGPHDVWVVLLFHRLVVASFPILVYLALRPVLPRRLAVLPAVLMIFMYASFWSIPRAYTEVSYLGSGLLAMVGVLRGVVVRPRPAWGWVVIAGLSLLVHSAIRPTGLIVVVGLTLTVIVGLRADRRTRTAVCASFLLPSLLLVMAVGGYHREQVGVWRLTGPSLGYLLNTYSLAMGVVTPPTSLMGRLRHVLPEVPQEHLFAVSSDYWLARYRLAVHAGSIVEADRMLNRAGAELIAANRAHYAGWVARLVVLHVLDPYNMFVPDAWYAMRPPQQRARAYRPPLPPCSFQFLMGPVTSERACRLNDQLRAQARWAPWPLPAAFAEVRAARWRDVLRLVTGRWRQQPWHPDVPLMVALVPRFTVPYVMPLKRLAYLSVWGVISLLAVGFLTWRRETRFLGAILGVAIAGEHVFYVFFGDVWQTGRWFRYADPYRYLATWMAAGLLLTSPVIRCRG